MSECLRLGVSVSAYKSAYESICECVSADLRACARERKRECQCDEMQACACKYTHEYKFVCVRVSECVC